MLLKKMTGKLRKVKEKWYDKYTLDVKIVLTVCIIVAVQAKVFCDVNVVEI